MDSSRAKKVPSGVHIKKAANGGYIVRHDFDNFGGGPSYTPPQEHAFKTHADMLKHVQQVFGHVKAPAAAADVTSGAGHRTGAGRASTAAAPGPRTRGAGVD